MIWLPKSIQDINHGPDVFHQTAKFAMQSNNHILYQRSFFIGDRPEPELNICDLQTLLIQLTGRFCEHHASDLLLTLSDLEAFTKDVSINQADSWVIGIGIREYGVDHNSFIISRLEEPTSNQQRYKSPDKVYRKLLFLHIEDTPDTHFYTRTLTLVDATHQLIREIEKEHFHYDSQHEL